MMQKLANFIIKKSICEMSHLEKIKNVKVNDAKNVFGAMTENDDFFTL